MFLTLLAQVDPSPSPTTSSPGGGLGGLIIFLPFVFLIFFSMRKQGRQRRLQQDLVSSLEVGDEIETIAGFYGRIRRLEPDVVYVELAPSVEIKMARGAVRRKVVHDLEDPPR